MAIECKKCSYVVAVQPGEKRPPWCPRCGSDLKETAPAVRTAAVTAAPVGCSINNHSNGAYAEEVSPLEEEPFELPRLATAPHSTSAHDEPDLEAPAEVFTGKLVWQAVALLCALVCFGIVAIAVSQLIQPPLGKPVQTGIYGVIGLFGIGGLVATYVGFRLLGQKYAVFPDRLIEWQSFKPTTIRWDQIREVFQDAHPAWTKFRVVTRLGRVLTITGDTKNHKRLGELIAGHVAAHLLPAALQELEAGRDVRMGPLRVSGAGVVIDGELEPWTRIGILTFGLDPNPKKGTSLISTMLHVRIGGSRVMLGDIPNFPLFEELARRLLAACLV